MCRTILPNVAPSSPIYWSKPKRHGKKPPMHWRRRKPNWAMPMRGCGKHKPPLPRRGKRKCAWKRRWRPISSVCRKMPSGCARRCKSSRNRLWQYRVMTLKSRFLKPKRWKASWRNCAASGKILAGSICAPVMKPMRCKSKLTR